MKKLFQTTAVLTLAGFLSLAWLGSSHQHHQTQADCMVCHVVHEIPAPGADKPEPILHQTQPDIVETRDILAPSAAVVLLTGRSPPVL